jgi:hypothetical protein
MKPVVFPKFAMVERFFQKTVDYSCLVLYSIHTMNAEVCPNAEVRPNFVAVENYFGSISKTEVDRHINLWGKLVPIDNPTIFRRYLFAFLSVHTTWENNVNAYKLIHNYDQWINDNASLYNLLIKSGVGLQNQRLRFISNFTTAFWSNPEFYSKYTNETWLDCRKRIEANILGLGLAKSSFALEMIYPMNVEVTCLDTHMFQLYGLNQNKHKRFYKTLESHWISCCKQVNISSYIARCIHWNRNQNQSDCTYWCYVFQA